MNLGLNLGLGVGGGVLQPAAFDDIQQWMYLTNADGTLSDKIDPLVVDPVPVVGDVNIAEFDGVDERINFGVSLLPADEDFVWEAYVTPTASGTGTFFSQFKSSDAGRLLLNDNGTTISFFFDAATQISFGVSAGTEYLVKLERVSGVFQLYKNGAPLGGSHNSATPVARAPSVVAGLDSSASFPWDGVIRDMTIGGHVYPMQEGGGAVTYDTSVPDIHVFLGDSNTDNTDGFGGKSYAAYLQETLPSSITTYNEGVGGWETDSITAALPTILDPHYDATKKCNASVLVGVNDFAVPHERSVAEVVVLYKELIDDILARGWGLTFITYYGWSTTFEDDLDDLNTQITAYCADKCEVFDGAAVLNTPVTTLVDPQYTVSPSDNHLNDLGGETLATAMLSSIQYMGQVNGDIVGEPFGRADIDSSANLNNGFRLDATDIARNGTFADTSEWTTGSGWSISGGNAICAGTGTLQQAYSAPVMTDGKLYRLSLTLNRTSGVGDLYLSSSSFAGVSTFIGSDGSVLIDVVCRNSPANLILSPVSGWLGTIDDVVLDETDGYIPALEDGSSAADGNPITHPGCANTTRWGNGSEVTYLQSSLDIIDSIYVTYTDATGLHSRWIPKTGEQNDRGIYSSAPYEMLYDGANWKFSIQSYDTWTLASVNLFPDTSGWPVSGTNGHVGILTAYDSFWVESYLYVRKTWAEVLAHPNGSYGLWFKMRDENGVCTGDDWAQYLLSRTWTPAEVEKNERWAGSSGCLENGALRDVGEELITDVGGDVIFTA